MRDACYIILKFMFYLDNVSPVWGFESKFQVQERRFKLNRNVTNSRNDCKTSES